MGDKRAEPETARKILKYILESPTDNASYVVEENGGERLLTYGYEAPYGNVYVDYLPTGLVETLLEDCDATLDKVLEAVVVRSVNGEERSQKLSEKQLDESERKVMVEAYATIAARFIIEGLDHKLSWALGEIVDESLALAGTAIQASIAKSLKGSGKARIEVEVTDIKEEINKLVKSAAAERKWFLEGSLKNFFPANRGRPTRWTKVKLETAVLKAARRVAKTGKVNLDTVADLLRQRYPSAAPTTGEALRKMMKHYEIDWKSIKAEISLR